MIFCVASGRQYASLRRDFEAYADDLLFLCENGALVMQRDKRVLIDPVDASFITRIVTATRALSGVYPVVCRADVALIEKTASPEYQQQTVGKVSAMLADYKPDSENFDSAFVQMDSLVRTLPPGAVRDELERRIKDVREEKFFL